jgi:hypothetical protein
MSFLTRSWVLYPLLALVCAGLIWLSLGPNPDTRTIAAQAGTDIDGAVAFGAEALSGITADEAQPLRLVRGLTGRPAALRLAVVTGAPAPTAETLGARLSLTPDRSLALSDKPLLLELDAEPFATLGVEAVAISLQDGASPVQWITAPIAPGRGVTRFTLPATPNLQAIGVRPVTAQSDGPRGVTIYSLKVSPAA